MFYPKNSILKPQKESEVNLLGVKNLFIKVKHLLTQDTGKMLVF